MILFRSYIRRNKMIIIMMMNDDDDVGGNPPRKSCNGGTALLAHRIVGFTLPPVHKLSWGGLIDYDNYNDKDDNELGVKDVSYNEVNYNKTMWWYSHLLVIHRPTDDRSQYRVGSVRSSQLRNPTTQPAWMSLSASFHIFQFCQMELDLPLLQASHSPPERGNFLVFNGSTNERWDLRSDLILTVTRRMNRLT